MLFHLDISDSTKSIRILQLTDSHLLVDADKAFAGVYPTRALQNIIQHAAQQGDYDCVLTTGDIAQESTQHTYQTYFDEVDKLNTPHFWIRGNHDDSHLFPAMKAHHDKNQPTVICIKNWCLILLNSQLDEHVHGEICTRQLDQLSELLKQHPNQHILIALHHHIFPVGCDWLDPHRLNDSAAFLQCIESYPQVKLVVCGHVHQESTYHYKHITFLSSPSTCIQFKPNSHTFALDNLPPGYRVFDLHADGQFSTQVFRLKSNIGEIDHDMLEY